LEDERETAPLVWLPVAGLLVVSVEAPVPGAGSEDFCERASLISWGINRGVVVALSRLIEPSGLMTSGLAARKRRVARTLSMAAL